MAVVPKQRDPNARYDPNKELTAEQLHRFGKVANKAQARRDEIAQRRTLSTAARAAKDAAMKPIVVPKKDKPNSARYAAWMLVVMAFCLWLMFMSR
ncbi:hypothetical protein [Vibrio neptunius]|uniref:Uncharacterized protein n=1 Tax=Vibrio neptunius TaxID=170651 RepID=A0ABS3A703_9VIBR|nr:hypothetical protein [Vibrio neptunius]MBN3495307.1 hypothetical protein [Vibrio neptunius]MBN3517809.1 hypothetical protein [Vibrio neptunius]MBN3552150.1 hypothetical protein [Vibrio neptunius]MBN3580153.1 hypothetical protein [Vibrio neptunius]MCH9873819.1 hypothetical protein [Vibrio neptunius]